MIVLPYHVRLAPPLDGALGWTDEFACLALLFLAIIFATFLVRLDDKDGDDQTKPDPSDHSAKK